jgi:hypothetical protein
LKLFVKIKSPDQWSFFRTTDLIQNPKAKEVMRRVLATTPRAFRSQPEYFVAGDTFVRVGSSGSDGPDLAVRVRPTGSQSVSGYPIIDRTGRFIHRFWGDFAVGREDAEGSGRSQRFRSESATPRSPPGRSNARNLKGFCLTGDRQKCLIRMFTSRARAGIVHPNLRAPARGHVHQLLDREMSSFEYAGWGLSNLAGSLLNGLDR